MGILKHIWKCMLGPRLYTIYGLQTNTQRQVYAPNTMERMGNKVIQGLYVMYNVGLYTAPIIVLSVCRWDNFNHQTAVKLATSLGLLIGIGLVLRGLGRQFNPAYTSLTHVLDRLDPSHKKVSQQTLEELRDYDFDFFAFPVTYEWKNPEGDDKKGRIERERLLSEHSETAVHPGSHSRSILSSTLQWPIDIVAYIVVQLIGRPFIYPGSVQLLHFLIGDFVVKGREKLVRGFGGKRNKIRTVDGNLIDTMFVDRRTHSSDRSGQRLVVCCEGNAGFYEMGIAVTPLEAGYSVLGWNHPGFAGSTGLPYPEQERNAVDAVMQFAINGLGFDESDIIVYSWSIGGYTGSWAAFNYPKIAGVILDATFDHILPLALQRMPSCISSIVNVAIGQHFNLNVAEVVAMFNGPIYIIRRTRDEIITTDENELVHNRANHLLQSILQSRYPQLCNSQLAMGVLWQWLAVEGPLQGQVMDANGVDPDACASVLDTHGQANERSTLGEHMTEQEKATLLLYLGSKYLLDFNSSHNNPLDVNLFNRVCVYIDTHNASYAQVD